MGESCWERAGYRRYRRRYHCHRRPGPIPTPFSSLLPPPMFFRCHGATATTAAVSAPGHRRSLLRHRPSCRTPFFYQATSRRPSTRRPRALHTNVDGLVILHVFDSARQSCVGRQTDRQTTTTTSTTKTTKTKKAGSDKTTIFM